MRLFSDSIAILSAREQPLYFAGEFEDNCPLLWKEKERKKERNSAFCWDDVFLRWEAFCAEMYKVSFHNPLPSPTWGASRLKTFKEAKTQFSAARGRWRAQHVHQNRETPPICGLECEGVNACEEARKMPSDDASVWIILALPLASIQSFAWICMCFLKLLALYL